MPKMSIPTLEVKKNFYVIPDGEQYHYFAIKLAEGMDRPVMRFDKGPPVLMEGIVIVGAVGRPTKLYHVPIQDLMRGIIRKSREIKPANRVTGNGSPGTATSTSPTELTEGTQSENVSLISESVGNTLQSGYESRISSTPEMEISQAANLAWTEQIDSLLSFISEKEGCEWEIADPAQS
jgi:hypothetical protein